MTHNTCSLTLAYIYTNSLLITNNSNKFHLLLMLLFLLFLRYFHRCFLMVTLLFTFRASNDTQHMQSHNSIYTNSLLITNNNNYFHLLLMLMLLFFLFRIVMDIIIIWLCWFYFTLLTVKVMVPHLLPLFICIVNLLYNMTTR